MTPSRLRHLAAAASTLALSLVLGLAHAQDNEPVDADPPDRAARLSYLEGDVSMQPAGEGDWAPALLNRPLTTGDKVWTEKGGRAEIQVGQAAVRLGPDTGFSFLNVDDDTVQMRITAGVAIVRVNSLIENDHIEIDTPNVALSLLRPGNYRVEVNDAGDTTTVRISAGEAEAIGSGEQNVILRNQQVATFRGTEQVAAQFGTLGGPDEFDSWSLERDRRDERVAASPTSEYVSPDVTGYEDLDDNGSWVDEPEYGHVWTPSRVPIGWAPYTYGRWVWVRPWGWTWIDDQPWGYAPFHYGRWAYARSRWCWVPGPRAVRAVYAPALVGWVGSPGVGVSVSFGHNVGWFPLGPREVYVPARRFSHGYVQRVNMSNTVIVNQTYITNVYNNRERNVSYRNRGAATAVAREIFTSGRRVGEHRVRIDDRDIPRSQATAVAPRIAPSAESRFGGAARAGRPPPQDVMNRQVVMRREPPASSAGWARRPGARTETPRTLGQAPQGGPQDLAPRDSDNRRVGDGSYHGSERPDRTQYTRSSPKMAPALQPAVSPPQPQQQQRPSFNRPAEERADRPSRGSVDHYQQQFREMQHRQQEQRQQREPADRQEQHERNVERPPRYERPSPAERPSQAERPQRFERPQQVQRPQQSERAQPAPRPQEDRSSRSSGSSSSNATQARPPKGWGHSRDN